MAFYDRIAKQWHTATGFSGGALKRFVLNDILLNAIASIDNRAVLELGAGNGYFFPLVLRRYSGQNPSRLVISDQSGCQLDQVQKHFRIDQAEYMQIDVCSPTPFEPNSFDLVLATMVFNEISKRGVASGVSECHRIIRNGGQLLLTVIHPDFVASLRRRRELRLESNGLFTMPGSNGLRLPVQMTSRAFYEKCLTESGFKYDVENVFASKQVLNAKPALKKIGNVPLALMLNGRKQL